MDVLPKLKILTVDDSRTNLQLLQAFLDSLGHTTIPAENGEQAVLRYRSHQPDLVLMDIMMPVMGGLEATRHIRALPSERWVPIIFLSALDRDENLVDGLAAGGDDHLSKPLNFAVLEAKIRSIQRMIALQQTAHDTLRHLQTISDNVLEGIVTIDSEATITSCNRSVEDLFGWRIEELVGQNVKVLCPSPWREMHDSYVREYVAGGPPQIIGTTLEAPALRRDGSTFPAEIRVSEVRLEAGRMFIGVIRDISERHRTETLLRDNAERLQRYYERTEAENALAMSLMERQLMRRGLDDPAIRYWLSPAENFSGDVLAAARAPDGRLYALLADATGHGLAAAISTVPLLTLFYRCVPGGMSLSAMLAEINQQLRDALPVGRFVGATLVCLDCPNKRAEIWVGGMPSACLIAADGTLLREFPAHELPLGIVGSAEMNCQPVVFEWQTAAQLILHSDGLIDAESPDGKPFGRKQLLTTLVGTEPSARRDAVQAALAAHLSRAPAADDISLLLLDCPD
ncbi:MAG: SpoIIE family protein phosphatase [Azospira sp.]|jgi:PAS domain S-box-containing protein|nr:SpoIIE family protein phosphatase [Azospira sp.]